MTRIVTLVTGATGPAGRAVCRALLGAGHSVVGVGHDAGRLAALVSDLPGLRTYDVDLADAQAVERLGVEVREAHGHIDGLIHLVGGWRGGAGFDANTDEDWEFLSAGLIDTLRHLTLALQRDLAGSPAGRAAIVSSTAVTAPTAGNANYVAAKAAAEAWMLALADSFRSADGAAATAASTVFAVKAFVDDTMRAHEPNRRFPGFTDVEALGAAVVDLWRQDATALNGTRIVLPTWDGG